MRNRVVCCVFSPKHSGCGPFISHSRGISLQHHPVTKDPSHTTPPHPALLSRREAGLSSDWQLYHPIGRLGGPASAAEWPLVAAATARAAAPRGPGAIAAPQSGAGGTRAAPGWKTCVWSTSLRVNQNNLCVLGKGSGKNWGHVGIIVLLTVD